MTQRELRNQSGEIVRVLDRGESFEVTRNGVPVGELGPVRRRHFAAAATALASFRGALTIDGDRLRTDLDRVVEQGLPSRG